MDSSENIRFTAPRLSLPLFMISRNRIKFAKINSLKKYIKKNIHIYGKHIDPEFERATIQYFQHVVGMKKYSSSRTNHRNLNVTAKCRITGLEKSWYLPPSRYDTSKKPFDSRCGMGGAYWPKRHIHQAKPRPSFRQPLNSFYNTPTITERLFAPCLRTKGVFLSNARERRATSRCMVSNIGTCYKNPSEPGPTTYNPSCKEHTNKNLSSNVKKPNPHLFYRLSTVPVKINSIHTRHTSFTGAPGRYEIRYPNICPCSTKLVYQPQINLIIEKEKRKKFRRLPYQAIKTRCFTSPDWRHVKGRGFRHLFKGAKLIKLALSAQEGKKLKNIQLYPDSKYIAMINNPLRTPLFLRPNYISTTKPQIKFNCIAKRVTRKQLRNNKKIAFSSTQERFRDSYRLPILTLSQQEQLKQSLPYERQFRDHPIMNKLPSDIKSKLYQTPKHMQLNYEPKLRKKIFKFQALPQAKVLVTENDTNTSEAGREGYYLKILEANDFFKDKI
ncbi:uncharacterized protein LOC119600108 [Lucilia sericata]|uniref:uncharacterized protein LOC119600108 n=1 Tax=Lucilia sericata TaxID=13632 RepID=UPI0018A7F494|nr:uncharacterized protein LOC119600108 [Lucilia sericata]